MMTMVSLSLDAHSDHPSTDSLDDLSVQDLVQSMATASEILSLPLVPEYETATAKVTPWATQMVTLMVTLPVDEMETSVA